MNILSNEELENGFVDGRDMNVFKIQNVLLEDNIITLKHHFKRFEHYYLTVGYAGQRKWALNYPEISKRLQEVVSEQIKENVITTEIELCVYAPEFGYEPKLYPHYDHHVTDGQRLTMSIQIDSNIDWDIVVENKNYKCNKNEGIVFSGTQQIHWREKYNFKKLDYSASVFAHFRYEKNRELSPNQKEIMDYWEQKYQKDSGIGLDPVILIDDSFNNWGSRNQWVEEINKLFPERNDNV